MALSKLVGRVEWVADNVVRFGDEHWATEPLPARAVTEQVADTLEQAGAEDRQCCPVREGCP